MGEQTSRVEKRGIGKKARIALAGLAALGTIEAGGAFVTEMTNDQPASIVRTLPNDLRWPITLVENLLNRKIANTFDSNAEKTKFGENNVVKITTEEAESKKLLEPTIRIDDTNTVVVTTLLPGLFPPTIPDTQISSEKHNKNDEFTALTEKQFIMPEDFHLTIPKGMHYALFEAGTRQNPDLVYTIVTFYYDPVSNVTLSIAYETAGFVPENGQKIFDRKTYNHLYNPSLGGKFEDLPVSDGITSVAKPASNGQVLDLFLFVHSGKIEHYSSLAEALSRSMNTTWENYVDQNKKLIVISSQ